MNGVHARAAPDAAAHRQPGEELVGGNLRRERALRVVVGPRVVVDQQRREQRHRRVDRRQARGDARARLAHHVQRLRQLEEPLAQRGRVEAEQAADLRRQPVEDRARQLQRRRRRDHAAARERRAQQRHLGVGAGRLGVEPAVDRADDPAQDLLGDRGHAAGDLGQPGDRARDEAGDRQVRRVEVVAVHVDDDRLARSAARARALAARTPPAPARRASSSRRVGPRRTGRVGSILHARHIAQASVPDPRRVG